MATRTRTRTSIDSRRLARLLDDVRQEVELLHLRLAVTRLVARDVSAWVNDDAASLELIIDAVLAGWRSSELATSDPAELAAFWNRYANRVEWAPPESGNEYRVEFCPAEAPGSFDLDNYFHAVWTAHVAELRALVDGLQPAA